MPRYFFHICDGKTLIPDEEGMEFSDFAAAKAEAHQSIRELVIQHLHGNRPVGELRLEIVGENGAILDILQARERLT